MNAPAPYGFVINVGSSTRPVPPNRRGWLGVYGSCMYILDVTPNCTLSKRYECTHLVIITYFMYTFIHLVIITSLDGYLYTPSNHNVYDVYDVYLYSVYTMSTVPPHRADRESRDHRDPREPRVEE